MPHRSRPRLGLYYFVLRGPGGRNIFTGDTDYPAFVDVLASLAHDTCYRIYAFCLLPGRVHLAVRMSSVSLQDFIQRLTLKFGHRMQRKQGYSGTIFAPPHRFRLVDDREKVRELIRFIHLLPLKLGQDPAAYGWSSHRTYLGKAHMPGVDARAGLRLFGPAGKRARNHYAAYILHGLQPDSVIRFERQLARDASASGYADIVDLSSGGGEQVQTITSLEQLAAAVAQMGERRFEDVRSNSRERDCSLLRAVIAWHAHRLEIANLTEVAGYLRREPSTLCAGIKHYSVLCPSLFEEPGNLEGMKDIFVTGVNGVFRKRSTQ